MYIDLLTVLKGIEGMLEKSKTEDAYVECAKTQLKEVINSLEIKPTEKPAYTPPLDVQEEGLDVDADAARKELMGE